jgi:hypothetical protein
MRVTYSRDACIGPCAVEHHDRRTVPSHGIGYPFGK